MGLFFNRNSDKITREFCKNCKKKTENLHVMVNQEEKEINFKTILKFFITLGWYMLSTYRTKYYEATCQECGNKTREYIKKQSYIFQL